MKVKYLPHTADIRMVIESNTIEGLFVTGVKGMNNVLKEGFCAKQEHTLGPKTTIAICSLDYTSLLIDFLSDILSLSYAEKSIYCKIQIQKLSPKSIVAEVWGATVDGFDEEIKAVTYHEAQVLRNKNGNWETRIIFDI